MLVAIVSIITFAYLVATSIIILLKNSRKPLHLSLAVALVFFGMWLAGIAGLTTSLGRSVMYGRLIYAASIVGLVSLYLFVYFFAASAKTKFRVALKPREAIVVAGLLIGCAVSPFLVKSVESTGAGRLPEPVFGPAHALFVLWLAYTAISIAALLIKTFRHSQGGERNQAKTIMVGLCLFVATAITTNVLLPQILHNHETAKLTPLSTIILAFSLSYAVLKYKFLDIRLIIARSLAYIMLLSTIVGVYALFVFVVTRQIFGINSVLSQQITPILVAVVLALTFHSLKQFFDKITNRLFYQDAYDPQVFLDELNLALIGKVKLRTLMRQASQVISKHLKPQYCLLSLEQTGEPNMRVSQGTLPKFSEADIKAIHTLLPKLGLKQVVTDNLETEGEISIKAVLARNNIEVINPLAIAHSPTSNTRAYLILGSKKSGNRYSGRDLKIMNIVAHQLVIAMQNAVQFEEIQNFSHKLEEKVLSATTELRHTNDKLLALDEAKDDFISMASHQLRTPLTGIKGYTSMVLEGDAGKLTPTQKKLLSQSFASAQRMVYLITDLLNVSRIRTGKFTIEQTSVNLAELVQQELEQLQDAATSRSLTLTYKKPDSFPEVMLDETKIRQVIMNFVDNAIYYTPPGGHITVEVENKPLAIELRVTDDGIGVPQAEQAQIFSKFYRAPNARKARPDGTGLGLFMANKVVLALGGAVIFKSKEGVGSTFGFVFSKAKAPLPAISANKN